MIEQIEKDDLVRQMLAVIYQETDGDMNKTVSMWTVGEKMGLDRGQTEFLALDVVDEGLAEIKNLSGGLGLTESGLAAADTGGGSGAPPVDIYSFINQIDAAIPEMGLSESQRSDMEIDLGVLKAQQDRSQALGNVITAVLGGIEQTLQKAGTPLAVEYMNIVKELIVRG